MTQLITDFAAPTGHSMGLVPRDYAANPSGYMAAAATFPDELLIPEVEWKERLEEQQRTQSSLLDIRGKDYDTLKSLNQDGYGYCWAFSTTKAMMYLRAIMGQPGVRLSAWAVAAIIKNYRDQGGWCTQSLDFIVKHGVPTLDVWPQGEVKRSLDTPEMRANAALHKCTEWWDGTDDREKNWHILVTALLLGLPLATDFNHWGHSVCSVKLVSVSPPRITIDNSWDTTWGDRGCGDLEGWKAKPDGLVIPRVQTPSIN